MEKLLSVIILFISVLYASNDISILSKEQHSRTIDMLIKGNGEKCTVSMDNTGVLIETSCSQLTNSKKIKILCTKNKKICKTVSEVRNALFAKSWTSSLKDLDLPLASKVPNVTPSFDCTKASNQIEHDICNSDIVSKLDFELGDMYLKIKEMMSPDDFKNLTKIQKEWVTDRDYTCGPGKSFEEREECLIEIYKKRIDAFSLISVMDFKMDYTYSYSEIYKYGTGEERFELSAYLYHEKNDIKKATKLLRKIISDNQEVMFTAFAFFALNEIHKDYANNFPQVTKKLLEKNDGSIGLSLLDLNATHDEVINVLIEEAYLLNSPSQIMLSIRYKYSIEGQPAYDKRILSYYEECADEGIPRCKVYLGEIYLNGWGVKQNADKGIQLLKESGLGDAYLILGNYHYIHNNIKNSQEYYKKASELGELEATYNLGVFAQEEKKYEEAIKYFETILKNDETYYPAMAELSRMHIEGWGVKVNYDKAIDMLKTIIENSTDQEMRQSSIHNLSIVQYRLGMKHLTDKDSNKEKAFMFLEKSAEKNNMYAQYELAKMYFNGDGVKKDEQQVIKWYKKAADQGHPKAQLFLSLRYLNGKGIEKDHDKGLYWARKSAESGDSDGQYLYGGLLLEENREEAIKWLEKAAMQGHDGAQESIDKLLKNSIKWSRNASFVWALKVYEDGDKEKAFALMKDLAKKGNPDAQGYLGKMYHYGIGVKEDKTQAKIWYSKAAAQNNAMGMYGIGNLIDYGNRKKLWIPPTGQARNEAIRWYEKSAALGNADAALALLSIYSKQAGDNYDKDKAIYWAERAAGLGSAYNKYDIASRFKDEILIPRDLEKSRYWFKKAFNEYLIAASNGDGDAQATLASMYYYGKGTPKNIQKAIEYIELSLKSQDMTHHAFATELLQTIEKETSYNSNRIKNVDSVFGITMGDKVSNVTSKPIPDGDKESFPLSMDIEIPKQASTLGFERAVISFTLNTKQIVSLTVSTKAKEEAKKIFDNTKSLLEKKYGVFIYKHSPKSSLWFEKKINDITIRIILDPSRGVSLSYISERYEQMQLQDLKKFKWADRYGL